MPYRSWPVNFTAESIVDLLTDFLLLLQLRFKNLEHQVLLQDFLEGGPVFVVESLLIDFFLVHREKLVRDVVKCLFTLVQDLILPFHVKLLVLQLFHKLCVLVLLELSFLHQILDPPWKGTWVGHVNEAVSLVMLKSP